MTRIQESLNGTDKNGGNRTFYINLRDWEHIDWSVNKPDNKSKIIRTKGTVNVGKWYFLCFISDGAEITGYVSGDDGKVRIPKGEWENPNPLPVTASYSWSPESLVWLGVLKERIFDGIIDEVYLWDRALTKDEVEELALRRKSIDLYSVRSGEKLLELWGAIKRR